MTDRIDTEETTMTTYTAEDFANAEFARHPDGAVATRFGSPAQGQWRTICLLYTSDAADE